MLAAFRKHLSAPGLLKTLRSCFQKVPDHRSGKSEIPLVDALMSGLAVFGLKYPSLLKFDEERHEGTVRHNLSSLYGVERAPCDTQLREILDPVDPRHLRPAYKALFAHLQRGKGLAPYAYLEGYYLVSIDGTGVFSSSSLCCKECCVKNHRKGGVTYFHQLLGAVIVHPEQKVVIPLAPEPITRQDGATKNDCERNAAKRLLTDLRREHPHLKLIVVEDALASNGPHIQLLQELDMRFILGVKPGDHQALFEEVDTRERLGHVQRREVTDENGVIQRFRFVNAVPLNQSHPALLVNFLEYWEVHEDKVLHFSWITDFELSDDNLCAIMRGGRARWKIENETFNTLKNQDYHLEHNYGHGKQHLATNFGLLMMLAFLVDQVQELWCATFQAARKARGSRTSLWHRMRSLFTGYYIESWRQFFEALIHGHTSYPLQPDTS
jgi:DDE family transposase